MEYRKKVMSESDIVDQGWKKKRGNKLYFGECHLF